MFGKKKNNGGGKAGTGLYEMSESVYDERAEAGLLACIMHDGSEEEPVGIMGRAMMELKPEVFYYLKNRVIYEAMLELWFDQEPVDTITLAKQLVAAGELEKVGGYKGLNEIDNLIETTAHWRHWLNIILFKWKQRKINRYGNEISEAALKPAKNEAEVLERIGKPLDKLNGMKVSEKGNSLAEVAELVIEEEGKRIEGKEDEIDRSRWIYWMPRFLKKYSLP